MLDPLTRSACFDPTGTYRYRLDRGWDAVRPVLAIIMLNPSRADQRRDDPTIRRCIGLAQHWGYGALTVVNLFAYCTAYPRQLRQVADPVGPENDEYLKQVGQSVQDILLAWGNAGSLYGRDRAVLARLSVASGTLCCLGINGTGQPRHPLYVPRQTVPLPWPSTKGPQAQ